MSKTYETFSFYYKTQTRTTKGTRLTLDLGKMMDPPCSSCVGRSPPQREKKKEFLVCFGEK